ncbi:MAG: phospholipase D family protein [Candidatus Aureabacteria bacterium]|nr:phospholipase D family protein [Candidatus Auribacterota bacterium]
MNARYMSSLFAAVISLVPILAAAAEPPPSPRNLVFVSPFCGYAFTNYNKKTEVLDPNRKTVSTRPGDLSFPLIDLIRRSEKTIDIACYLHGAMTPEHDEIVKASQRGVRVRLLLDPSIRDKDNVPVINEVVEQLKTVTPRIPVKIIDPARAEKSTGIAFQTMHEKFGIIDGRHVFNGSANIEANANVKYTEDRFFFLDNPAMVKAFQAEFDRLWDGMGQYLLPPDTTAERDNATTTPAR